eukprot:4217794-Pleurochrysis_carterae.AAC.1
MPTILSNQAATAHLGSPLEHVVVNFERVCADALLLEELQAGAHQLQVALGEHGLGAGDVLGEHHLRREIGGRFVVYAWRCARVAQADGPCRPPGLPLASACIQRADPCVV